MWRNLDRHFMTVCVVKSRIAGQKRRGRESEVESDAQLRDEWTELSHFFKLT